MSSECLKRTSQVSLVLHTHEDNFDCIFRVWEKILLHFEFDAVVVQCGADGLSGDPLGGFNLTQEAYGHCLRKVLAAFKPTLVLGGGK